MSKYENIKYTRKCKTDAEIKYKKYLTLKQLEKDFKRKNRKSSIHLGKNEKNKATRIPLGRLKRKPSHRNKRPDTINFNEDNPLEYCMNPYYTIN